MTGPTTGVSNQGKPAAIKAQTYEAFLATKEARLNKDVPPGEKREGLVRGGITELMYFQEYLQSQKGSAVTGGARKIAVPHSVYRAAKEYKAAHGAAYTFHTVDSGGKRTAFTLQDQ